MLTVLWSDVKHPDLTHQTSNSKRSKTKSCIGSTAIQGTVRVWLITQSDPIGPNRTTIYIMLPLHITLRTGRPVCRRDSCRYA